MVHRLDFEHDLQVSEVRVGHVLRVELLDNYLDYTGFVTKTDNTFANLQLMTGPNRGESKQISSENIKSVTEILSCPLFYRLAQKVAGEMGNLEEKENIKWVLEPDVKESEEYVFSKKPRLIFKAPPAETYKRVWHFMKLFPTEELEFCTNVAIFNEWEQGDMPPFDTVAFFAA